MKLIVSGIVYDRESTEYGAAAFVFNNQRILFRIAKTTPTKVGQFVTIWKRIANGPIQPFDESDPFDFLIVRVQSGNQAGQFVFPKKILSEKKIISKNNVGGKRAMRVYAPWVTTHNKQATQTQKWQINYFENKPISLAEIGLSS